MKPQALKKITTTTTPGSLVYADNIASSTRHRYTQEGFIRRTGKHRYELTPRGAEYLGWKPSLFTRLWRRITG